VDHIEEKLATYTDFLVKKGTGTAGSESRAGVINPDRTGSGSGSTTLERNRAI
jgi:hypothetical protein